MGDKTSETRFLEETAKFPTEFSPTWTRLLGYAPDPWQIEVLELGSKRLLLNCCRQAGKSTVAAILALYEAAAHEGSLVLILSRSHRQSAELFHTVARFYQLLGSRFKKR